MTITANPKRRRYEIEEVARSVEWLADLITTYRKDLTPNLTQEERDQWATYPDQVRAHRHPFIFLEPETPLIDYLKSGQIGPYPPKYALPKRDGDQTQMRQDESFEAESDDSGPDHSQESI